MGLGERRVRGGGGGEEKRRVNNKERGESRGIDDSF